MKNKTAVYKTRHLLKSTKKALNFSIPLVMIHILAPFEASEFFTFSHNVHPHICTHFI